MKTKIKERTLGQKPKAVFKYIRNNKIERINDL